MGTDPLDLDTFGGGKLLERKITLMFMKHMAHQGPTTPFYKSKGSWTFYVYPNGVPEEAGNYRDEDSARKASLNALHLWQANGCRYG